MDPKTGKFYPVHVEEGGLPQIMQGGQLVDMPPDWPTFTEGEVVEVKGWTFRIQRINVSSIVLRPCAGDLSARRQMESLT